jgi:hypothetical protein
MRTFLFLATVAALPACAGDAADFELIGFSEDGSRVAWLEHGFQDGSGFEYCSVAIQDTGTGGTVRREDVVIDYGTLWAGYTGEGDPPPIPSAVDSALTLAGYGLGLEGIVDGNIGVHCLCHPLTDLGTEGDRAAFATFERTDFQYYGGGADVTLHETEVPVDSLRDWWGIVPVMLRVDLRDRSSGETHILSEDAALDPERSYWWDYRIRDVYSYCDTTVVIVLSAFRLGFEGSDVRHFVVCGDMSFVDTGW